MTHEEKNQSIETERGIIQMVELVDMDIECYYNYTSYSGGQKVPSVF